MAEVVLYSPAKERGELLQPRPGLMQFPVGVALRDPTDLAAGQAARVIGSQRCFPFSHPLFYSWACAIKISVSQSSDWAILVLLWQKSTERIKKRSQVAGKGGQSGQSADSGFGHARCVM